MKRIITATIAAIIMLAVAVPVYAIDLPDSTPTVESINVYRNILETSDMLVVIYENTSYATAPDTPYDKAFIWRLYDTDGTTELAQITGYPYDENGYGYNVIGFYLDADDAPTWEQSYPIKLTGTPTAFDDPPTYAYQINAADYSELTDTDDVKNEIGDLIISLALELNTEWGLTSDNYLTTEAESGTVLSLAGESFFRGAIYGIQAMASGAFSISVSNFTVDDRTWSDNYTTALSSQLTGTDIGTAMDSGNTMLDSSYNLFGLLILFLVCAGFIGACIYVGGDIWGTLIFTAGIIVVGTRMSLLGLGELGLIAAIAWLFTTAKTWKVV